MLWHEGRSLVEFDAAGEGRQHILQVGDGVDPDQPAGAKDRIGGKSPVQHTLARTGKRRRRRWSAEQKATVLQRWEASELSAREFAAMDGIPSSKMCKPSPPTTSPPATVPALQSFQCW